jgi:hypothetical protein
MVESCSFFKKERVAGVEGHRQASTGLTHQINRTESFPTHLQQASMRNPAYATSSMDT